MQAAHVEQAPDADLRVGNRAVAVQLLHEARIALHVQVVVEEELVRAAGVVDEERVDDAHAHEAEPAFRARHVEIDAAVGDALLHRAEVRVHRRHRQPVGHAQPADGDGLEQERRQHAVSNYLRSAIIAFR